MKWLKRRRQRAWVRRVAREEFVRLADLHLHRPLTNAEMNNLLTQHQLATEGFITRREAMERMSVPEIYAATPTDTPLLALKSIIPPAPKPIDPIRRWLEQAFDNAPTGSVEETVVNWLLARRDRELGFTPVFEPFPRKPRRWRR